MPPWWAAQRGILVDGELITAIAAVVVAVAGTGYSAVQTRTAKDAAKAATDQVDLMRRQIEREEKDRFESSGPAFEVDNAHADESDANVPRALVKVKQASGSRLVSVVVAASGAGVEGMRGAFDRDSAWNYRREECIDLGASTPGAVHDVYVDLDFDTHRTDVHLTLVCYTEAGERWERALGARVEPLPEPPRGTRRAWAI
ncbi:hypothetical protein ACIOEW_36535 [Streptomyces sp. NPDC087901]|uniref:hypothetical protein n=1 Tax=Streptomyces sp. NPDC087901 TaxID=3365818 RepID=UPI00380DEA70